jgi:hypothetical protein
MASDAALGNIGAQFPDWHLWRGVGGLLYGRRPRSSPPKVVRVEDTADLTDALRRAEDPRYWERALAARAAAADELAQQVQRQREFDGPVPL